LVAIDNTDVVETVVMTIQTEKKESIATPKVSYLVHIIIIESMHESLLLAKNLAKNI